MDLAIGDRRALVTGARAALGPGHCSHAGRRRRARRGGCAQSRALERTRGGRRDGRQDQRARLRSGRCGGIEGLRESLEQTDILVINSGGPPPSLAAETPDAVWSKQFEAMFLSAVRLTRLALPGMRKRGFGRLIAVVSSGVIQPIPNLSVSNSLRAAWSDGPRRWPARWRPRGSRSTASRPGPHRHGSRRRIGPRGRAQREGIDVDQVEKEARAQIPAGRYGQAAEFAPWPPFWPVHTPRTSPAA